MILAHVYQNKRIVGPTLASIQGTIFEASDKKSKCLMPPSIPKSNENSLQLQWIPKLQLQPLAIWTSHCWVLNTGKGVHYSYCAHFWQLLFHWRKKHIDDHFASKFFMKPTRTSQKSMQEIPSTQSWIGSLMYRAGYAMILSPTNFSSMCQ